MKYTPDAAELFLAKHDPLHKKKNRKSVMEYPYLSQQQEEARRVKEIPESCLSKKDTATKERLK